MRRAQHSRRRLQSKDSPQRVQRARGGRRARELHGRRGSALYVRHRQHVANRGDPQELAQTNQRERHAVRRGDSQFLTKRQQREVRDTRIHNRGSCVDLDTFPRTKPIAAIALCSTRTLGNEVIVCTNASAMPRQKVPKSSVPKARQRKSNRRSSIPAWMVKVLEILS